MTRLVITAVLLLTLCILPAHLKPRYPSSKPGGRIIGGELARAGQFPFISSITIDTALGRYFCAGSLLDHSWVLTAGQCVDGGILFSITLGSNSLIEDEPSAIKASSDTYYIHELYSPSTLQNDIGLIKFRLPITYSDYIQPINYLSEITVPDGTQVTTTGWGQISDEDAGFSNDLRYVNVVILSNEACRITYGSQITDGMLCVDGNFNEGTCNGDTGGPLIMYGSRGYTYHVGIASFLSQNGCESTDPSGFTRTSVYRDWIRDITTNN